MELSGKFLEKLGVSDHRRLCEEVIEGDVEISASCCPSDSWHSVPLEEEILSLQLLRFSFAMKVKHRLRFKEGSLYVLTSLPIYSRQKSRSVLGVLGTDIIANHVHSLHLLRIYSAEGWSEGAIEISITLRCGEQQHEKDSEQSEGTMVMEVAVS